MVMVMPFSAAPAATSLITPLHRPGLLGLVSSHSSEGTCAYAHAGQAVVGVNDGPTRTTVARVPTNT